MSGHTPGPWEVHRDYSEGGYPCYFIHGMAGDAKRDIETLDANANLMAAAPDMLAALKLAESVYRQNVVAEGEPSSVLDAMRAAIARAEGRS